MKLSCYTHISPSASDSDSKVLFCTKNASTILVPSGLLEDIEKGGLSGEETESLVELGFLVPSHEEEKREMLGFIREMNDRSRSMRYVVVLNLDCNLACKYCFEGTRKGKHFLSDEVEARFIDFVKRSDLSHKDGIQITFYGGEPLLSIPRIESISRKIRAFSEKKGLTYGFLLVTNGTLLTAEAVGRLALLGLTGAKVTLDGPKEVHDSFRPFRNGAGSFDIIVRNIDDVCERVRIQIGGNYTRKQYREFPRLLDHLLERGITPARVPDVKFDPVVNESSEFALPDFRDGYESSDEPWLVEASLRLRDEVLRRGFRQPKMAPSPCLMELDASLVIHYNGAIYKCPGLIGRKNCSIGDVTKGTGDYRGSHGLDDWKNEVCLACAYLPLCFGGCKYVKLVEDGSMRGTQCRKKYFDRTLAGLLAQDIKYDL
jgi:uncharacterized protein